jgi:hypothetical protein
LAVSAAQRRQPHYRALRHNLALALLSSKPIRLACRHFITNSFSSRLPIPVAQFLAGIAEGTKLILETKLKGELVAEVKLDISEILDPKNLTRSRQNSSRRRKGY